MANQEIVWDSLTRTEAETLANLVKNGREIFAAPIEIEDKGQLDSLGISWNQCRTWRIGAKRVTVHLTPSDEETYRFLLSELRTKYRNEYRASRCMVPGVRKPLIRCPECNHCTDCPFPEYRERHQANTVSWDSMIESGFEGENVSRAGEQMQAKVEYEDIRARMVAENPLIAQAFEMKERDGFSVEEIAIALGITRRSVYYFLSRAKEIGRKYQDEA